MTPIMQALAAGYGEEEILKYLSKSIPTLSKSIQKARNTGYTAQNILGFLSKTMQDDELNPYLSQQASHKSVQERRAKLTKDVLKTGATALASYGAARAIPSAIQGVVGAIKGASPPPIPSGQMPQAPTPPIGPQPMGNAPVQPPSVPSVNQPITASPSAANVSTATAQPQPQELQPQSQENLPSISPQDSIKIVEEMGIGPQIQALHTAGNNPEAIATAVNATLKGHQRQWFGDKLKSGQTKPLIGLVEDYLSQNVTQNPKSVQEPKAVQQEENRPSEPVQKGSIVATPDGDVVEVKDARKKEALIDDNGKISKFSIKDLQEPDETVRQTVARLLEIPEIDKSALINYWSYDPEDKQLFLMFHNGETYKYFDVPEELEQELAEAAVSPKTKGQNEFGAWSQEDPNSRGATFIQKLIAHPKYKKPKKGENPNPNYRKLRKGYDYWQKLRK